MLKDILEFLTATGLNGVKFIVGKTTEGFKALKFEGEYIYPQENEIWLIRLEVDYRGIERDLDSDKILQKGVKESIEAEIKSRIKPTEKIINITGVQSVDGIGDFEFNK